jgi:hypothetical protein
MQNRLIWAACLAVGVAIGFFVGRGGNEPGGAAPVPAEVPGDAGVAASSRPSGQPTSPFATAQRTDPAPATSTPRPPDAPNPAMPQAGEAKSPFAPPVDSGVVNPVDAGEVFNKQIARASTPEQPNELADAHRAFEREPRDEGWAYTMEADLQNAMLSETSMGAFKMEHVECRTTICEVRVSGRGDQADAVRNWSNSLPANTFNQQLFMNVSSTISSHERIDAIYIFRRPARRP